MKVALLHLSDLHFKISHIDVAILLSEKIASALAATIVGKLPLIVVCSGDLAFSGQREEYDVFDRFYNNIVEFLVKRGKIDSCHLIAVPGNHDCDFTGNQDVRNMLLQSRDITEKAGVVDSIMSVQVNFWNYIRSKSKHHVISGPVTSYYTSIHGLSFLCINTAWTSQRHEIQGKLRTIPYDFKHGEGEGFVISVFHHPYNWLDAEDGFNFKRQVEETSAIAFSGHEHSRDSYTKARLDGGTAFIEAGALLENSPYSRFNLAIIDSGDGSTNVYSYIVKHRDRFVSVEKESIIFTGNLKNVSNRLALINQDYRESISRLNDFVSSSDYNIENAFIYPNLEKIVVSKRKSQPDIVISEDVIDGIIRSKKCLILGEANSGKTSFANKLFIDFYKVDYYPLRLSYDDFKGIENSRNLLDGAIAVQYREISLFQYLQIDSSKRVLIIDDIPVSFLSAKDIEILLDLFSDFENIVVFSSTSELESLITNLKNSTFEKFEKYKILGLNPYLRRKFIQQNLDLSSAGVYAEKDRSYYKKVSEIEIAINTSLRSNLIPAYPIYLAGIMQYYINSSGKPLVGSNNFVYDLLVKMSIAGISTTDADYSV